MIIVFVFVLMIMIMIMIMIIIIIVIIIIIISGSITGIIGCSSITGYRATFLPAASSRR